MKKYILITLAIMAIGCSSRQPPQTDKACVDSIQVLNSKIAQHEHALLVSAHNIENQASAINELTSHIEVLNDSIVKLNGVLPLTEENFLKAYKYDRLEKYYRICKNNPTQWKFYKGWSIRVFEH